MQVSGKDRCAQTCAAGWRFLNRQDLGLPGHQKAVEPRFRSIAKPSRDFMWLEWAKD